MNQLGQNGHANKRFDVKELANYRIRPTGNPAKAAHELEAVRRITGNGTPLESIGPRVARLLRMTTALWEMNGRMGEVKDQLGLPNKNGLPRYEPGGNYSTLQPYEESHLSPEEARQLMEEIRMERNALRRVVMAESGKSHEEICIEKADQIVGNIEEAYPRQYYG